MHLLTSFAETSSSPLSGTLVLPPSGLVTVVSIFLKLLNQFLFTTLWSEVLQSTTRSCSVASLVALCAFRLQAKLPVLVSVAFFMQACARFPFAYNNYISNNFSMALGFDVSLYATAKAFQLLWTLIKCCVINPWCGFLGRQYHMWVNIILIVQ